MGDFHNRNFPEAVDSDDVLWFITEWRIQLEPNKCVDCGGDYSIYPNQFEDLPPGTTKKQALARLKEFETNRRENVSTHPDAPVRQTLFLSRIVKKVDITDDNNNLYEEEDYLND